ncbi:c-type cytochrome [Glaciimonas immobilis]|uniref:Cytochrome c n=1 Tax=Glaciimonas immobilis TaxID=728004 RepID=A0A840RQ29_9BURK|nr:c-type cytochrome [Glaciimonas immobilis]KAF3999992.1 c-type cytochrome [Glaciimonas immobilis]MBB5200497.1 cytochrome c [Glaciimonas immobilis]
MTCRASNHLLLVATLTIFLCGQPVAAEPLSGEKLFKSQCAACHSAAEGSANRQGPNLWGVFGRGAGLVPGMAYSAAFRKQLDGKVWTEAMLNSWLEDPQNVVPDTLMMYRQDDAEKRLAIIAYLKTLH